MTVKKTIYTIRWPGFEPVPPASIAHAVAHWPYYDLI